jgi:hypothetical protein
MGMENIWERAAGGAERRVFSEETDSASGTATMMKITDNCLLITANCIYEGVALASPCQGGSDI